MAKKKQVAFFLRNDFGKFDFGFGVKEDLKSKDPKIWYSPNEISPKITVINVAECFNQFPEAIREIFNLLNEKIRQAKEDYQKRAEFNAEWVKMKIGDKVRIYGESNIGTIRDIGNTDQNTFLVDDGSGKCFEYHVSALKKV